MVHLREVWTLFVQRMDNPLDEDYKVLDELNKKPDAPKKKRRNSKVGIDDTSPSTTSRSSNELAMDPSLSHQAIGHVVQQAFWDFCSYHHPDEMLLRFLRARKWNVEKAFDMLWKCLIWRIQMDVHGIFKAGETNIANWCLTSGVAFYHNFDQQKRPILMLNCGRYDKSAVPLEMNKKHAIYMMELAKNYLIQRPVETVTLLVDLEGFSMANFDFGFVKFLIGCLEAYYPESLGQCIILNAPIIFSGVWKMIKPLLDPVVAAKISFLKIADLPQHIAKDKLLAKFQGEDCYTYQYLPITKKFEPDSEAVFAALQGRKQACQQFLQQTLVWITSKEVPVQKEREDIVHKMNDAWWDLDSVAFEPTHYHRRNVVQPRGQLSR